MSGASDRKAAEAPSSAKKELTKEEIAQLRQESLELGSRAEERRLAAYTRVKQETKDWAERIPGQVEEVKTQMSTAGRDEMKGLSDRLASLNSTLITVSTRYADMVDGWDEFVGEKNANIAKYRAQLDAMTGEKA